MAVQADMSAGLYGEHPQAQLPSCHRAKFGTQVNERRFAGFIASVTRRGIRGQCSECQAEEHKNKENQTDIKNPHNPPPLQENGKGDYRIKQK